MDFFHYYWLAAVLLIAVMIVCGQGSGKAVKSKMKGSVKMATNPNSPNPTPNPTPAPASGATGAQTPANSTAAPTISDLKSQVVALEGDLISSGKQELHTFLGNVIAYLEAQQSKLGK